MIEELPQGYAGFKQAICLKDLFEKKTGLCVITGKNGSGKTKLLNYCYDKIRENNRNNRNIAIFRQANYNWDVEEDEFYSFYRYKVRKNSSFIDIILDNIIDESKDIDNKEQLRTILFSENDYYKSLREKICNEIFPKILKKYIGENDIKKIIQDLGYPTADQIKAEIRDELQKIKKQGKKNSQGGTRVRLSNNEKKELEEEIEKKNSSLTLDEKEKIIVTINNRNTNLIDSTEKLITHLMKFSSFSKRINTVIKDLSELIYNDYIRNHNQNKKQSIWEKINTNYLDKYNQFKYLLVEPHPEMSYSVSFCLKDKTDKSIISFNDLSTGEKALFELFYYVYATSDEKLVTSWIFLDELDANLNPEFIKVYIEILGEIKKTKKIFISTHNPITVISADFDEIFELDRDNSCIKRSKNKENKREILENLAPGFFIEDDFGYIGMALGGSSDIITIFVEGKHDNDKFYLEEALDKLSNKVDKRLYRIISCGSESIIKNVANMFRKIPELGKLLSDKRVVFLFDHDTGGFDGAKSIVDINKFDNYIGKVEIKSNNKAQAYALLLPKPDYLSSYNLSQKKGKYGYAIEHMYLVHSEEDYNNLISSDDNWENKKKQVKKDVKGSIYNDYSNFARLFNVIENLFKRT